MKRKKRFRNKENGFTLIEVLVVLFVIGIIMAIATPNMKAAGEKAQAKACEANQKLIKVQLENYYLENHAYPSGAEDSSFILELAKAKYLDSVVSCPSGGEYKYDPNHTDLVTKVVGVDVNCSIHHE